MAFAYFMVGQAAVTRNNAQTAADAAALAAAQDARDQLRKGWLDVALEPERWEVFLQGRRYVESSACERAAVFASKNGAQLEDGDCVRFRGRYEGFSLTVSTAGGEGGKATASAKAVIKPNCAFGVPGASESEAGSSSPGPVETGEESETVVGLSCGGVPWVIDPDHPELPNAADLFIVRLVGDDE
ncbi:pilus assembly protein TadG-related protein [Streptomyces sp. NPDC001744]|uniref:pilus assembly protein TadG-related protein n=1 Tax=Streptomyces sp. NPDC001744 TaxID=3364606 RepID=UPI003688F251